MIRLGIFARTFQRDSLPEVLAAVREHGLDTVQFNLSCAGLPTLPETLELDTIDQIRHQLKEDGITIAALSGTFNMAHPDGRRRKEGITRLRQLIAMARPLGTTIVTLCTGTRDPDDMWRRHPENDSAEAWRDLVATLEAVLPTAEQEAVTLAFEPELGNVIASAAKARLLLDELHSRHLRVVMDAANLLRREDLPCMRAVLEKALELLAGTIVLAHAKDVNARGETGNVAPGAGVLDFDHYLARLGESGYDGDLIMHGLPEAEVERALTFLREKLAHLHTRRRA